MAEQLQNDIRHTFLLFASDFSRPFYSRQPLYEEAVRRYRPLQGTAAVQTIQETKKIIEIVAILGGQWPHSSFMVPGGVVSVPTANEINQCRSLLARFRQWYEQHILGCTVERWQAVTGPGELDNWLDENESHRNRELGFFIRFARLVGLDNWGGGHGNFISFGALAIPDGSAVIAPGPAADLFLPQGVAFGAKRRALDPELVTEDVTFSRLTGYTGGRHPFEGATVPDPVSAEGDLRSWAKAPRYDKMAAETGPLAERIIANDPLFCRLVETSGPSVFARQLARLVRPALLMPAMETWLREIASSGDGFFNDYEIVENAKGHGLTEAHRGALGHWITIENGKIASYQVITPTAWNASPRDEAGMRGPMEEALIGLAVADIDNPIELEHVVRSFDPCLVCTVHAIDAPGHHVTVSRI